MSKAMPESNPILEELRAIREELRGIADEIRLLLIYEVDPEVAALLEDVPKRGAACTPTTPSYRSTTTAW